MALLKVICPYFPLFEYIQTHFQLPFTCTHFHTHWNISVKVCPVYKARLFRFQSLIQYRLPIFFQFICQHCFKNSSSILIQWLGYVNLNAVFLLLRQYILDFTTSRYKLHVERDIKRHSRDLGVPFLSYFFPSVYVEFHSNGKLRWFPRRKF